MEFDEYGNKYEGAADEMVWFDEESAAPGNYGYSNYYMYNGPGDSRTRGGYAQPPVVPRFQEPRGYYWGKGYGPAGPPKQQKIENDTVSFLLRCGVPHYMLSGLPNHLLRHMEPGFCGICTLEFNCFSAAQLHYNSKQHIRNLKRWQIKQAQAGCKGPKENPIRARELYCELCDVHITSKVHAESHYSGRSHNAIVEGRKPPKNLFLLHKNMEERVEKLIRREKKCLKVVQKTAAKEKVKTDSKPISPELHCTICSTTVTSPEQMTMHLNGKRHLVNEKKHIFKMMKGETTIHADAQNVEAQGAESRDKENPEVQENDFDWGQGGGSWEDDPQ